MGREWQIKTFKSGNSVAFRLPKALGIGEGENITVVPHADGSFSFWRQNDALEVLMSLQGTFSPGFMAGGRQDDEQLPRDWSPTPRDAAA